MQAKQQQQQQQQQLYYCRWLMKDDAAAFENCAVRAVIMMLKHQIHRYQ
jgi:hypothetical protein